MAVDIDDEEAPPTTLPKRQIVSLTTNPFSSGAVRPFVDSTMDTATTLLNMLGELKR